MQYQMNAAKLQALLSDPPPNMIVFGLYLHQVTPVACYVLDD